MKASNFEFRFRYAIHLVIYAICFVAPWNPARMQGGGRSLWSAASLQLARTGIVGFGAASASIVIAGILASFVGAGLRTWGGAYLVLGVAEDSRMHGAALVADGPYRHMRNPLYVGTWLHTLGLALVMSPAGGIAAIVLIGIFQLRLIGAEEAFLSAKLGAAYAEYCSRVPRLFPALRAQYAASGASPRWASAVLNESYFWLFAISFSVLAWRYDRLLLEKAVLVSLGCSMILRAVFPSTQTGRAQQA